MVFSSPTVAREWRKAGRDAGWPMAHVDRLFDGFAAGILIVGRIAECVRTARRPMQMQDKSPGRNGQFKAEEGVRSNLDVALLLLLTLMA